MIKITTNKRTFTVNIDDIPVKNRGAQGTNLMSIANEKLKKGEEIIDIEFLEVE